MMLCVMQRIAAALLVSLLIFASAPPAAGAQSSGERSQITLNPAERYQFIQGFGVNFTSPYFRDDQKAMFDMLIKDLGATMFRVVPYLVYSNWEEVNDNNDPNVMNWSITTNATPRRFGKLRGMPCGF